MNMTTTSAPSRTERKAAKRSDPARVPFGTMIAWSSAGASYAASIMVLGFVTIYCTDTLGLNAGIVGAILLVSKILDAIGVLFAGWFVDRSPETRWGKARPYELSIVGVWAATGLLFSVPGGIGDVAKYVWVFVAYLVITALFTPLLNGAIPLYLARAYGNRDAITRIQTRSGIVTGLFAVLTAIAIPVLVNQAGKDPGSWTALIWTIAVPLGLFGLIRFFVVKEKFQTEDSGRPKVTFTDVLTVLRSNRYLWSVAAIQFMVAMVGGIGVGAYYFRYIVGNLALLSIAGLFNLLMIPLLFVLPRLVQKFTISKVIAVGSLISALGFALLSLGGGGNLPVVVIGLMLSTIGTIPIAFLLPVLIIDNATYNEWKGNRRLESIGGSVTGFAGNVGGGVSAGVAGLVLSLTAYNGTLDHQGPAATTGIIGLASGRPAALSVITAVVALSYGAFERRLPTITAEVEVQRMADLVATDGAAGFGQGIAAGGTVLAGEEAIRDLEGDSATQTDDRSSGRGEA